MERRARVFSTCLLDDHQSFKLLIFPRKKYACGKKEFVTSQTSQHTNHSLKSYLRIFVFSGACMLLLIAHDDRKLNDEELLLLNPGLDENETCLQRVQDGHKFIHGPRINLDSLYDQ